MKYTLLEGFSVFEKKERTTNILNLQSIEFIIHNTKVPLQPNSYFLCDKNKKICIFKYFETNNDKIEETGEAFILYKFNEKGKSYKLKKTEASEGRFVIINEEKMAIEEDVPFLNHGIPVLENNEIVYIEEPKSEEESDIKMLQCSIRNEKLLPAIPCYLKILNRDNHTAIHNFVFSNYEEEIVYGTAIWIGLENKYYVVLTKYYNNSIVEWLVNIYNMFLEWEELEKLIRTLINIPLILNRHLELKYEKGMHLQFEKEICYETAFEFNYNTLHSYTSESLIGNITLNDNLILEVLSVIIQEGKIVFISNNPDYLFQTIYFFMKIIYPFKWEHLLCSPLPEEMIDVFDSPFPFIIGYYGKIEDLTHLKKNVSIVEIDKNSLINNHNLSEIPFKRDLLEALKQCSTSKSIVFRRYFKVLENNVVIARENHISRILEVFNEEESLKKLENFIFNPQNSIEEMEVHEKIKKFFKDFSETRIFKRHTFVNQKQTISQYFINIDSGFRVSCVLLPYVFSECLKDLDIPVYRLWLSLYQGDLKKPTLYFFKSKELLERISSELFHTFSERGEYKNILWFYKLLKKKNITLSPKMYSRINVRSHEIHSTQFFEFYDLSNYFIIPLKTCECKILYSTEEIRLFLEKHSKDKIDFTKNSSECSCDNKYSTLILILFIEDSVKEFIGLYRLIHPDNINEWKNTIEVENINKDHLLKNQPLIFWNIAFYFSKFNLPINDVQGIENTDIDFYITGEQIVEENRNILNLCGLPYICDDEGFKILNADNSFN